MKTVGKIMVVSRAAGSWLPASVMLRPVRLGSVLSYCRPFQRSQSGATFDHFAFPNQPLGGASPA